MRPAAGILLLLLATGCNRGNEKSVRIVTYIGLMETFPLELAQELGYFHDEGVQVFVEHAPKAIEAVLGGSCDMAYEGYTSTLQAAAAGRRLTAFFVANTRTTTLLAVSPQKANRIRRVEDLKGALVGITTFGSTTEAFVKHVLRQHGMTSKDVTYIPIGTGPKAVAALEHGKVDAAFTSASAFAVLRRRAPGVRVLVDPRSPEGSRTFFGAEAIGGYSLASRTEWLTQRPDVARRIAKAMVRTLRWVREHSIEEVYLRMHSQYRSDDKQADLETLSTFIASLSPDGRMPPGGAEAMQRIVSASDERVLKVDLASTYTNEFLEAK